MEELTNAIIELVSTGGFYGVIALLILKLSNLIVHLIWAIVVVKGITSAINLFRLVPKEENQK